MRAPRSVATRDAEVLALGVLALDVLGDAHWNAVTARAADRPHVGKSGKAASSLDIPSADHHGDTGIVVQRHDFFRADALAREERLTSLPPTMAEAVAVEL